jgi:sugar phosphate isomerase/epimerase
MPAPISVQLYSLRTQTATDMEPVLRRLADIGYVGVEPAGFGNLSAARFREVLDDTGLQLSSAHTSLPVGTNANEVLDEQDTIGNTVLITSGRPDDFASLDAVKRTADKFNAAAVNAAARGMTVGYHNHWWEFGERIDGRLPYEVLQDNLDPTVVSELDIYWTKVGGVDPVGLVRDLGPKAQYLHVKDGACEPKMPMTAVGQGTVDIDGVLSAAGAARWHIVELDECATDMFEAIEESYRYLVGRGLSTGR